jgi:hypothetical protein
MAAVDVLDEGVPGGGYSCAAELFEPAHCSQSGLQPSVIGFDRIISVLLGDMAGGRHQLVEYPRVGGRVISGDLDRGRPVFQGVGEESPGATRSRFSATNTSMTCPNWSMARHRYTHRPAILA